MITDSRAAELGGVSSNAVPDTVALQARRYAHPQFEGRMVVRLVRENLAEVEDLSLGVLGFTPDGAAGVGHVRNRAIGFPAWPIITDPANSRHALNLVGDLNRAAKLARSKAGPAKELLDELAGRLGNSAPHFLPTFLEEGARIFLRNDNLSYAMQFFNKAREAEARIEEANQRALEAEVKAQEAEAKIEEAGQQVTQADLRVSEAEARAAEAEARAQQVDQHISDAEQARRQVVELEERINKQEIDMARLENRATAAWDKTMPNLIERIESLEGDLSQARREAAELQALLAAERDQATPASATEQAEQAEQLEQDEQPEQPEQDERPEVPQTEIIKEEPWQAIGTGVAQETPIAFAPSTPEEDAEDQDPEQLEQPKQPGEPVDEVEPQEETKDEETKDEKTPDEEAEVEEKPEVEEEVRAPEQLAPTAVVEHEVELPAPEEKTKDQEDENQENPQEDEDQENPQETENQEDHQETENREEPEQEPAAQEETTDLSALTDTGSFAKLVAPGPAPEDPTPMDLPETEHLVPTAPVYPVTAHHDDATIPDIPRITAPIAQPFGAEEDTSGWRRTMTPDTSQPKATGSSPEATDLLIDETEVDEVPVVAGLPEPGPVAEPSVNEGHIVAPQFGMAGQHDGVPHSPLEPKGDQLSISLEEDYTLVDPIDESIAVMEDLGEEFPVGVGIPPEDYPRIR